ncbi:unnamed protein product [Camellia sinensis]
MGCFLACFGSSKDRKRRNQRKNQVLPRHQIHGIRKPLQPIVSPEQDTSAKPVNLISKVPHRREEQLSLSTRKKVTFDTNIKTYEPVSVCESIEILPESNIDGEMNKEESSGKSSSSHLLSEDDSVISSVESYPSHHRYQNCRDSDDEVENFECAVSDLDGDDDEEEEDYEDNDEDDNDRFVGQEVWFESIPTSSMESSTETSSARVFTEEVDSHLTMSGLGEREVKTIGSNRKARDRSVYVHPVLNPVENLTQWKAVKSNFTLPLKAQNENFTAFRDSDDEVKEFECEVSDLDGDDVEEEEEEDYEDNDEDDNDRFVGQEVWFESIPTSSMESSTETSSARVFTKEVDSHLTMSGLGEREVKTIGSNRKARDRSVYVHPVLNPVENLTQWKAVKSNFTLPLKAQNENFTAFRDSDDEVKEFECEVSDLDGDDVEEEEEEDYEDNDEDDNDRFVGQEVWFESIPTSSMESSTETSSARVFTEEVDSHLTMSGLGEREVKTIGSNRKARDRSVYVHPVLNPVENLTQWKAVKSNFTLPLKAQNENFTAFSSELTFKQSSPLRFKSKPDQFKYQNQEIAVDASLSSWIVSSETTPSKKTGFNGFETMSQGSNSVMSIEDRPILLTVEELKQFSASSSPRGSPSRCP